MFLKTGFVSITLLLASRLLGLLRESAQAAAFGTSGLGDVAVLVLSLPDWLTGMLASGALAYVLLPHWAVQTAVGRAQSQRRVAQWLLGAGVLVALLLAVFAAQLSQLLISGLPPSLLPLATQGLRWSAVALPAALLAALWVTRLQHERDFTGMYAANLVINGVLIAALYLVAFGVYSVSAITLLGLFLWLAMMLRLGWLRWRLKVFVVPGNIADGAVPMALPRASLWGWAALSAGLPLMLPFVARSLASAAGEGALVTFNYAWKLVELPLVLAIQLVATLSFPAITRALAADNRTGLDASAVGRVPTSSLSDEAIRTVRGAFLIAWTLACACAAALQVGAPTLAHWLFGWGRMPAESLVVVAEWGAIGAFGLLPQALIAVALSVLASLGRMRAVVWAYAAALVVLLLLGLWIEGAGALLMMAINVVLSLVALVAWLTLPRPTPGTQRGLSLLPWQAMMLPAGMVMTLGLAPPLNRILFLEPKSLQALILCSITAMIVIAMSYFTSAELRAALKR
ncbi:MAG: hypothetical protein IPN53_10670 [Comamonadaceae bacterium]|nr:hypothetical protein [Comamonadaceae bacterium]